MPLSLSRSQELGRLRGPCPSTALRRYSHHRSFSRGAVSRFAPAISQHVHHQTSWSSRQSFIRRKVLLIRAALQEDGAKDEQDRAYVRALLMACFATRNRCLLATQSLLETCLQLYRSGFFIDDIQSALSIAGLESLGNLLDPMEQEIILTWVSLCFITADLMGLQHPKSAIQSPEAAGDRQLVGMRRFAGNIMRLWENGMDTRRLLLQQALSDQGTDPVSGGPARQSPSQRLMQQHTRIIMLTLEAMKAMPSKAAEPAETEAPRGYITAFMYPADSSSGVRSCSKHWVLDRRKQNARAAAMRLLVGFTGAAQGSLYCAQGFVDDALACYRQGWAVGEITAALGSPDFTSCGGLFKVANIPAPQEAPDSPASDPPVPGTTTDDAASPENPASSSPDASAGHDSALPAGPEADGGSEQQGGAAAEPAGHDDAAGEAAEEHTVVPDGPQELRAALPDLPVSKIFGRWLSIVYMAAVHLGVPREAGPQQAAAEADTAAAPASSSQGYKEGSEEASSGLGWAWAAKGGSEAMEAQRTSDFVFHLLQGQADDKRERLATHISQETEQQLREGPDKPLSSPAQSFVVMRDEQLPKTSSSVALLSQQARLVTMAAERVQQMQPSQQAAA